MRDPRFRIGLALHAAQIAKSALELADGIPDKTLAVLVVRDLKERVSRLEQYVQQEAT